MSDIKRFLEGALDVVDGLSKARDALGRLRGTSQGPARVIEAQYTELPGTPPSSESTSATGMTVRHHEVKTIEQRVAYIISMIQRGRDSAEVRRLAVQAVSTRCGDGHCVPEGDYDAEVIAVCKSLRQRYRYVRDTYGKDLFQHPARTLEFGGGDCDDISILICSMLGSIGYPTRLRVIRTKTAKDWNHIYCLVGLPPQNPTRWVPIDLSVPGAEPGWEAPANKIAQHKDFDVPVA